MPSVSRAVHHAAPDAKRRPKDVSVSGTPSRRGRSGKEPVRVLAHAEISLAVTGESVRREEGSRSPKCSIFLSYIYISKGLHE